MGSSWRHGWWTQISVLSRDRFSFIFEINLWIFCAIFRRAVSWGCCFKSWQANKYLTFTLYDNEHNEYPETMMLVDWHRWHFFILEQMLKPFPKKRINHRKSWSKCDSTINSPQWQVYLQNLQNYDTGHTTRTRHTKADTDRWLMTDKKKANWQQDLEALWRVGSYHRISPSIWEPKGFEYCTLTSYAVFLANLHLSAT